MPQPNPALESLRESWFGAEAIQSQPEDLLVRLGDGVRHTLDHESLHLTQLLSDSIPATRASIVAVLGSVENAMNETHGRDPGLRVALMGRTMSGKSTLFEFLTSGDGTRIGKGAQRTTRKSLERPVSLVPNCVLVDTPGVGARDGEADRLEAFRSALTCDVILWVAANDSTQEETAASLRDVAQLGKPILLFMNCREKIDTSGRRKRLITDPDRMRRDIDGHWARLHAFIDPVGVTPVAHLYGHALAAHMGCRESDEALLKASNIDHLLEALRVEAANRRHMRRAITVSDTARGVLAEAADILAVASSEQSAAADAIPRQSSELQARIKRVLDENEQSGRNQLTLMVDHLRTWYTTVDLSGEVAAEWDRELQALDKRLAIMFETLDAELHNAFHEELDAFIDDWTPLGSTGATNVKDQDTSGAGNRLAKLFARSGPGVAGVLGVLALGTNPAGWAVATIGLASLGTQLILEKKAIKTGGWIDRWLPSRNAKRDGFREHLREQTRKELDETQAKWDADWRERLAHYRDHIQEWVERSRLEAGQVERHSAGLASSAERLDAAVNQLDTSLTRALLRLGGRDRVAAEVAESHRIPGIGSAIGLSATARDELVLFPLFHAPEPMLPFIATSESIPASVAADVVFSGSRPPFRMSGGGDHSQRFFVAEVRDGLAATGLTKLAGKASGVNVEIFQGVTA